MMHHCEDVETLLNYGIRENSLQLLVYLSPTVKHLSQTQFIKVSNPTGNPFRIVRIDKGHTTYIHTDRQTTANRLK